MAAFLLAPGIERYFIDRERLREAGVNADELRALGERYGVGDTIQSQSAEPAYVSSPGARRDGVVVTGRWTRNAYALLSKAALPEHEHVHADQEEAFYVISGTPVIEIDGKRLTSSVRSFILARRGVRRRHIAAPGTRVLTIFSPGHTVPLREVLMTQSPVRPARLRRQARLMNVVNVPIRLLLQLPFANPLRSRLMLLYLKGQNSGHTYPQLVSFVRWARRC